MKSILMSIKPKWIAKIASVEKTVEVRKSVPKCGAPFKVYMYETRDGGHSCKRCKETSETCYSWAKRGVGCYNGIGKVVGEFVCDKVIDVEVLDSGAVRNYWHYQLEKSCLSIEEIAKYIGKEKCGYGLHISDLKIYEKPKELSEFRKPCNRKCDSGCAYFYEDAYEYACTNVITRPPQSWCYVEEQGVEE